MTTTKNLPIDTIRDGSLKATIWKNESENGNFYTVSFSRTYKDADGQYRDANSFSLAEPLRIARLAHIAYDEIAILRAKDSQENGDES